MGKMNNELIDEKGLPLYFDMQAELGYTKHIGGSNATRELLELCNVSADKALLNVGCGAGTTTTFIVENYGCHVVGVDIKPNIQAPGEKGDEKKQGN